MAKINRKITFLGCTIVALIFGFAYVVNPVDVMRSVQTMTEEATTQHERIMTDRHKKPLITIREYPEKNAQIKTQQKPKPKRSKLSTK